MTRVLSSNDKSTSSLISTSMSSLRSSLFNSSSSSSGGGSGGSGSSNSSLLSNDPQKPSVKEQFTRLESKSKVLLQTTMEKIARLKQWTTSGKASAAAAAAPGPPRPMANRVNGAPAKATPSPPLPRDNRPQYDSDEEEISIRELFVELRDIQSQMKALSQDMSTLQGGRKVFSPRVVDQIKTWELAVEGLHTSLRKLQLDFQQIMNIKRRDDLLSLSRSPFEEADTLLSLRKRRGDGPGTISASTTDSLLQTRQTLMETVHRSTGTLEQLAQSSLNIVSTQEDLKEQNTVVGNSRKLLSKYGRREWSDRILICFGLAFFFAVVGYIIQKRMF